MKGEITSSGVLVINGKTKTCPFKNSNLCSDYCALFDGPEEVMDTRTGDRYQAIGLCTKKVIFKNGLTDNRAKEINK
jgi:hypothetical protein